MDAMIAALPWGTVLGIVGIAGILAVAGVALFGTAAKANYAWAKEEIEHLKEEGADKDARILQLEADVELLTEKVTNAAAVRKLTEAIDRMTDTISAEHADLASAIGRWAARVDAPRT
jgi:chromosome segregation ATPase